MYACPMTQTQYDPATLFPGSTITLAGQAMIIVEARFMIAYGQEIARVFVEGRETPFQVRLTEF